MFRISESLHKVITNQSHTIGWVLELSNRLSCHRVAEQGVFLVEGKSSCIKNGFDVTLINLEWYVLHAEDLR